MAKKFGITILANNSFTDQGYLIKVHTIRLNGAAMSGWILSEIYLSRRDYKAEEAWEAYKATKAQKRKAWEDEILKILELDRAKSDGVCFTQVVSEIFTIVYFEEVKTS